MLDLRFPIGEFRFDKDTVVEHRETWLGQIEAASGELRAAVDGPKAGPLATPNRSGGDRKSDG